MSDERPGGWVEGIGWVARVSQLPAKTDFRLPDRPHLPLLHHGRQQRGADLLVIVKVWPDGSEPAPPASVEDAPGSLTMSEDEFFRRAMAMSETTVLNLRQACLYLKALIDGTADRVQVARFVNEACDGELRDWCAAVEATEPPVAAVRADQQGPDPEVTPFAGRLREHADAVDCHIPTQMNAETVRLLRSAANAIDRLHGAAPSGADQQEPPRMAECCPRCDGSEAMEARCSHPYHSAAPPPAGQGAPGDDA